MFDRFLEEAKSAVKLGQELARSAGDGSLDAPHILHGSMRVEGSLAALVVERCGGTPARLADWANDEVARLGSGAGKDSVTPFTATAKRVLEFAMEEAERHGHTALGTHHLLLGVLRASSDAARELAAAGVALEPARGHAVRVHQEAVDPTATGVPRAERDVDRGDIATLVKATEVCLRHERMELFEGLVALIEELERRR